MDGTFWFGEELGGVNPSARTAGDMGHLPVGDGSLATMRDLAACDRIYLHLNNTNPILGPDPAERAVV